jgi:type IV pilus assembly protein PilY1
MLMNSFFRRLRKVFAVLAIGLGFAAPANGIGFDPVGQDIDIFLANPAFASVRPNVLIILDNTANWNNAFANEKSALVTVFNGLDARFNVGLMMFTETGSPNSTVDGGYVRFAVRQMTDSNKMALSGIVNGLDKLGDKGNAPKYSLVMSEAYRYFAGIAADSGKEKAKTDYAGNNTYIPSPQSGSQNALSSFAGATYNSPIVDGCQKNFIILISNGPAGDNAADLTRAQSLLASLVGKNPPDTINITPTGEQNLWVDEFAKYMANNDCNTQVGGIQKVVTYTLDIDKVTTGQGPDHSAMLQSTAVNGKGKYFDVSSAGGGRQIIDALNQIFNEVQAVNSAFVSATLPVSVNVRGTNLNQVYIGLFRPDGEKLPRWVGNMKLYKLGINTATDTLFTADANGVDIFSSTTGFVTNSAVSYWTSGSSFWSFKSPYATSDVGQASDSPDGDIVEKGGTAQKLRTAYATSQAGRKIFTCTGGCTAGSALSTTPFQDSNGSITAGALGTYLTKPVTMLTSVGTTATATVTAHGFGNGNTVTIAGANPPFYNGDFAISNVTANTFDYTLSAASAGNLGNLFKTSHGITTGNLITVTGASPAGYNVINAPLTKVDGNNASYPLSAAVTGAATLGTVTITKEVTQLANIGIKVTATIPTHGYANMQQITISGGTPSGANGTFSITQVVDLDRVTYENASANSPSSTTAYVTLVGHPLNTGNMVTIAGATPAAFNGTFTVTKVNADTFSYVLPSLQSGLATGAITASITGAVSVVSITHPTTGAAAGRNVGTVTTSGPHGFANGASVTIAGASPAGYNGTYTITTSGPTSNTFTYTGTLSGLATPATGTITASGSRQYPIAAGNLGVFAVAGGTITSSATMTGATISAQNIAGGAITAGRKTDADTAGRTALINWVRGQDNAQDENLNSVLTDVRASIHGDVLHSRPQVVNYGRDGTENDVFVFYGANDGTLRSVKGGFAGDGGVERWAFVPEEFFPKLKRLRDNNVTIDPNTPKAYFFDGPISTFTHDVNNDGKLNASDGDKAYLFITMRRGGRYIYALDISDPDAPRFMWKRGCPNMTNNTGCDAGFEELGQTWSEISVGFLRAEPTKPMLFFGGGYDPAVEDAQPCLITANTSGSVTYKTGGTITYTATGTCSTVGASTVTVNRSMGRGIFVVEAETGNLYWRAGPDGSATKPVSGMDWAIAAELFVINRDGDNTRTITGRQNVPLGYMDRLYAADTGGNIWRVDLDKPNKNDWLVTKLASISGGALGDKRKFLYGVNAVAGMDSGGGFDAVLIGSGDREHPFDSTVSNRIYMFKDRKQGLDATGQATITEAELYNATSNDIQQGSAAAQTAAKAALAAARGWRVDLANGEKTTSNVVTVAGESFFNTNQPSAAASEQLGNCESNLGIARLYNINFEDATAVRDVNGSSSLTLNDRSQTKPGGGFPPPPVQVVVKVGDKLVEGVVTFPVVDTPKGPPRDARIRTYWKRKLD